MKSLNVSDDLALAPSVFDDVVAIVGRRGRGKTTTAAVIVEELNKAGEKFCVVDPTDAWWGLKSSRDGKSPGISCIVMGGEYADVPLAADSGEIIADFVADPTSPSCVLELKSFTQGEIVRFMTAFLGRLYHKNAHTLHLVLDEADQFAPQRPMPGEQAMLGHAQRVTKMGRVKGLHPILITQRPATLSKNVLTQAGVLICHAITGPQDRKALDEWIKSNADEQERDTFLSTLSGLPRGTAYFWSPDIPLFKCVPVRDRETFDSSATPGHDKKAPRPKALAEVDLEALREKIAATIEKAKAEDPRELRKTISELRAQLKTVPVRVETKAPAVLIRPGDVTRLEKAIRAGEATLERAAQLNASFLDKMNVVRNEVSAVRTALDQLRVLRPVPVPGHPAPTPWNPPRLESHVEKNGSIKFREIATKESRDGVTGPEQRILDAVAWLDQLAPGWHPQNAVAFLARYSADGGAFKNPRGAMSVRGLIEYANDQIRLTDLGRSLANQPSEPPSADEMQARVLDRLPGPETKILTVLLSQYPKEVSNETLAERTGYSADGGAFKNPRGRLSTLGLIQYRNGAARAHPSLFLEGV